MENTQKLEIRVEKANWKQEYKFPNKLDTVC
jgi:hypothetical protein